MITLAFDFGTKKIGVAVGEKITKTARALNIIYIKNGYLNWNLIEILLKTWEPKTIIVGLPLNINGTAQKITYQTKKFASLLENKFKIVVQLHDERLSTVEAKSRIFQYGGFRALKNKPIDSLAAVIILESWLLKK